MLPNSWKVWDLLEDKENEIASEAGSQEVGDATPDGQLREETDAMRGYLKSSQCYTRS